MIFEHVEDIFAYYPECIVHPVSSTGVSHDILSKQLKKSYPDYFREYTRFCIRKKLTAGHAHFYALNTLFGTDFIVTLTIKQNWQERIQPSILKKALEEFITKACHLEISVIALPQIEEVPQNWLKTQFEKCTLLENKNTIKKIVFF